MEAISSCVKDYQGKPAIHLNGVPYPPQIYALTDCPTANRSWERGCANSLRHFAQLGFRLFQLDLWFEDMLSPDGELDLTFALKQLQGIADICPEGAVMFRLHCNPPFWWLRENPGEWVRFGDVETLPPPDFIPVFERYLEYDLQHYARNSFASRKWLDYMGGVVKRFCRELSACPEADRLFAIQIANGLFGENHYWGFVSHDPDVSAPMQAYFSNWLRERYGDEETLRSAYHQPDASFETITVPGCERYRTDDGIFRDPQKSRRVCDYFQAQHKAVTDSIRYFCRIVKENWPRPIITGAFYGYYVSLFGRQAAGGHLLEQEILCAPEVDFLCAPQAYNKDSRALGGPGLSRGLIESVRLHGKLWLDEMDQPTHHGAALGGMTWFDLPQSVQNNRKCVLEPFVRGGGLWYYDFGKFFCAGWWDDPEYQADIAKIKAICDRKFHEPHTAPADVLLVCDTSVFFHTGLSAASDPITDQLSVNGMLLNTFMSGAAAATVYLSDLPRVDLSQYRAIVLVNCFALSDEQVAFLRGTVAGGGRSLIWCTAPGYVRNGEMLDAENVARTVGMRLEAVRLPLVPEITYHEALGGGTEGGAAARGKAQSAEQVFFAVSDPDAQPLGWFPDGRVAAAKRVHDSHTDYFFALPPVGCELQHRLFSGCGCHIYNQSGDSTLVGAGLVVVSSRDGGARAITLRGDGQSPGNTVRLTLEPAQTVVLDEFSGEQLL